MSERTGHSKAGIVIGVVVALAGAVAIAVVVLTNTSGDDNKLPNSFKYDLAKYRKTDPRLIVGKESAEAITIGFKEARAIAVGPGDRIYVAGDDAVRIFSSDGKLLRQIETAGSPRCLTVDADGTVYLGFTDHIEVFDSKGKGQRKAKWASPGQRATFTSIAISDSNVFVADAGSRTVLRYDKAGRLTRQIGGFVVPSPYFDLAVASDGLLRVVNPGRRSMEAYTFRGDKEFSWGKSSVAPDGFSGCCNPINFALLDDGGFVTCEKGLTRVKIYDADGGFVGVVAGPELFARHDAISDQNARGVVNWGGLDVAVDSKGRILVMDPLTGEVRIFVRTRKQ